MSECGPAQMFVQSCNFADSAKLSRDIYSSKRRGNRIERRVYSIRDQKYIHKMSLGKSIFPHN